MAFVAALAIALREGVEALEIGGREVDAHVVGRDQGAVDAGRHLFVDDAGDAPADLDRLDPAAKRLAEAALDQALEAPLEARQSHGR